MRRHKKTTAVILGVVFFVWVGTKDTPEPITQSTQQVTKDIPYEVIQSWIIPNGGYGKVIVISPTNVNEEDMRLLGEKLKRETANDRNSNIEIFSNKQAAEVRQKVLSDEASEQEEKLYDTYYVAGYSKNINTGYHQLSLHLTGINEEPWQEIKY